MDGRLQQNIDLLFCYKGQILGTKGFKKLILESDSKALIEGIEIDSTHSPETHNRATKEQGQIKITHRWCQANYYAHALANLGAGQV